MLVYKEGKTLARVGVMGESATVKDAPILRKCLRDGRDGREQYLAALQVTCYYCCVAQHRPPLPMIVRVLQIELFVDTVKHPLRISRIVFRACTGTTFL